MLALNGLQSVVKFISYWLNKPITLFGEFMQKNSNKFKAKIPKIKKCLKIFKKIKKIDKKL